VVTRAAVLALALAACIGETPEDRERSQVPSIGEKGPTHNPGSPCLLCHDFALAGTIYLHATDADGISGVPVTMSDADGHMFTALSNRTGNVYVNVDPGLAAPAPGREGEVIIPWPVVFPVNVEVGGAGATRKMRNRINRWGSCAECHTPTAGASSNGRIFVEGP
jgi:hypothetical protein